MGARRFRNRATQALAFAALAFAVSGCIPVEVRVPEPIQIELTVNIRQEVVYRLEGDARALLQERPDIF
ncbi:MAG: YnbE family lipoprotein [Alphaproteobacteria bacterium]|jgi:hypothetical protein|nr:YnbE family lipoprotein [Alphaproteobacteria bacterium]